MNKKPPLIWPDNVPRFVVRRSDDRRFFVYDLLRELRVTGLTVDQGEALRAVARLEAARRLP